MMKILIRIFVVALLLTSTGAGGYFYYLLEKEKTAFAELKNENTTLQGKVTGLQKKYEEKKAVADGLQRARDAAEARCRESAEGNKKIEAEKEELTVQMSAEIASLRGTLKSESAKLENFAEKAREEITRVKAVVAEKEELHRQALKEIAARDNDLEGRNKKIETLTSERTRLGARLEMCSGNNAKLMDITNELVDLYRNKGAIDSMLRDEPLLQYRKVQVEKLVQEYADRIEQAQVN